MDIYLDIETNGYDLVTVIGFDCDDTGPTQLVGDEISRPNLLKALPESGTLFTFNGERFDLPKIEFATGIDLHRHFRSCDLMLVGWAHSYRGGQKAIEDELGFERELPGLDGRAAIGFWNDYQRGNEAALETLLKYNSEDLDGMRFLKEKFESECCLAEEH